MKNVLFVCTANVFRSMSAEKFLKNYLEKNDIKDIRVDSAAIAYSPLNIIERPVKEALDEYKIDTRKHQAKQLTRELLEKSDVIVAMAKNHKDFIENNTKKKVYYFNELAKEGKTPVDDLCEKITDYKNKEEESRKYLKDTIRYIHDKTPTVYQSIKEMTKEDQK